MNKWATTKHASLRQAGRAISDAAVDAAMTFGRCFWAGGGCLAFHIGRRVVRRRSALAQFVDIAVIITQDGTLVTVEHCSKPPRHWRPA